MISIIVFMPRSDSSIRFSRFGWNIAKASLQSQSLNPESESISMNLSIVGISIFPVLFSNLTQTIIKIKTKAKASSVVYQM